MYYRYKKTVAQPVMYAERRPEHLFGCRRGLIPALLSQQLADAGIIGAEPCPWHIDLAATMGRTGEAIIVDMRPGQGPLLYGELLDVWGYSNDGWSPILLRFQILLLDADRTTVSVDPIQEHRPLKSESVYSFMYLRGSVAHGSLTGKWTPAGPSSTNAVLLWPRALGYFCSAIAETSPELGLHIGECMGRSQHDSHSAEIKT
jgi:hypothetical protein